MNVRGSSTHETKVAWQSLAPGSNQLLFFNDAHSRLDYQDIHRSQALAENLCGAVELNERPLIYIARTDSLVGKRQQDIDYICHLLACRGEEAFLATVSGGELILYPCLLKSGSFDVQTSFSLEQAPSIIRGLSEGLIPTPLATAEKLLKDIRLRKRMLEAFMSAAHALQQASELTTHKDYGENQSRLSVILALLGRALFMCFLFDRGLLPKEFGTNQSPYEKFPLFTDINNAAFICHWQDVTFNGDFLPLLKSSQEQLPTHAEYVDFFRKYPVLNQIQAFTNGEDENFPSLIRLLNFKHVPVDLLSEVYETFAHEFFEDQARATSIHYTPRHIASVLIDQAFQGIPKNERAQARILDPSAGAGVFLVLALQKIIQEKALQGIVVDAPLIRKTLYEQIRGMDISIHALRLSTLALYLAAIDLDPNPAPISKHHFDVPLFGKTILWTNHPSGLGSLGEEGAPQNIGGPFDLVIGNPPWTKISNSKLQAAMRGTTKESALRSRPEIEKDILSLKLSFNDLSPDFNPAFPFLWRALEWTKPEGIIALVLPAEQLLFREHRSRTLLFRNLRTTGIVNGSDLHESNFWEGMKEPFCLFFARNEIPSPNGSFLYLNLFVESLTAQQRRFRLDGSQAKEVSYSWLEECPYLLKVLFRGNELDLSILEKIQHNSTVTLRDFLSLIKYNGELTNGYAIKDFPKNKPENEIKSIREKWTSNYQELRSLKGLHLSSQTISKKVDTPLLFDSELSFFNDSTEIKYLKEPRTKDIYAPPLLIIPQAASHHAFIYAGQKNIIFSQSYFGVSLKGIEDAENIATYLAIIFNTDLPRYYALLVSARYGCNRRTILKKEIEDFPIVAWNSLSNEQRLFCKNVLDSWKMGQSVDKHKLYTWITDVYKLNKYEKRVIVDTLSTKSPSKRLYAQQPSSQNEQDAFFKNVESSINTLSKIYNKDIRFKVAQSKNNIMGWVFGDISIGDEYSGEDRNISLKLCAAIADEEGCSQIIINEQDKKIIRFGLLDQSRYWTYSQARLFSQKIRTLIDGTKAAWGLA